MDKVVDVDQGIDRDYSDYDEKDDKMGHVLHYYKGNELWNEVGNDEDVYAAFGKRVVEEGWGHCALDKARFRIFFLSFFLLFLHLDDHMG